METRYFIVYFKGHSTDFNIPFINGFPIRTKDGKYPNQNQTITDIIKFFKYNKNEKDKFNFSFLYITNIVEVKESDFNDFFGLDATKELKKS